MVLFYRERKACVLSSNSQDEVNQLLVSCLIQLFIILACYLVSDSMLASGSETVTRMRGILFTFLQNLDVAPP